MKHNKLDRTRDFRFTHKRRGELSYNGTRFPCLIQDISIKGVSCICARNLEVGQELEVTFDLTPEHVHRCKVRVQHIEDGCFGAEIIDAGEQESKTFQHYVEKRFRELKGPRTTGKSCRTGAICMAQACFIKCRWRLHIASTEMASSAAR